ncbi:MAG: cholest-4-en-3-one 26-monooxygenase [Hyphomicrobiaceae bacterium]|jgi:cholest-4-en-3-one 26-monooxygenase
MDVAADTQTPFDSIDLMDLDLYRSSPPLDVLAKLRSEDPVHWHEPAADHTGYWSVTRHADIAYVSRTPALFTSCEGTNIMDLDPEIMVFIREIMINMDPPRHNEYRNLVNKRFLPRGVKRFEEYAEITAREVVDAIVTRGECEFVEDVAALLPMTLICEMFGIPDSERRYVYDVANRLVSVDDPEVLGEETSDAVFAEIFAYAAKLAEDKRKNPSDDLASLLVNSSPEGRVMDDLRFGAFVIMLMVAGNETTRTVTTNGMRRLIEHPDQREAIRQDLSLLPNAIEEMLRFDPAVHHFRRTVTEDTELGGKSLKAGEKVILWYSGGNRDDAVFEDPDRFDILRANARDHVAFGIGQHFCLGAHLARLQLRSVFSQLITRVPDMELVGEPRRLRSNFINGVKEMRVRYTPAS